MPNAMAYQCLDCTYTAERFPGGVCPGCGSLRIVNLASPGPTEPAARKSYRLALAIALWIYLIIEIWKKLA